MNNAMAHLAQTIRAAQTILGYHVCDVLDPTQPPCAPGGTCYACEDKANTVEGYDSGCVHYELGAAFRAAEFEHAAQAEALEVTRTKAARWVAVSERLPEINDKVLVVMNWLAEGRIQGVAVRRQTGWWWRSINVTKILSHWQPLPSLPTKEASDE